jgi:hypothetical protein
VRCHLTVEDTACIQFSRQSSTTYGCSRPKTSRRVTKQGSFSEIWFRDLQLLESGSEKIRQTVVRESGVNRWLYVLLIYSDRRLGGGSYWKLRQIFRRKINIREDKLLLYHCLLELGLPKVSVSEQHCPFKIQKNVTSTLLYSSVADPDPDLLGQIRIRTFGTGSGSEATKIENFYPFLCWSFPNT